MKTTYWPWMRAQCAAAWAMRRTDFNITRNRWTSPTPADIDLKALETHSAFLVQQLTPESLPVPVDWSNKLTGTVIGTAGSFNNNAARTRAAAFDGNVATFFDAPTANENGAWAGLDLGTAKKISAVRYYPRVGASDDDSREWSERMLHGVFQGANEANFSDAVTLYSIAIDPTIKTYHLMPVTSAQAFRYVRYLSPDGGFGNVAEVEFYTPSSPQAPVIPEASRNGTTVVIRWQAVAGAQSYKVKRSSSAGGTYQVVGANVTSTFHPDTVPDPNGRSFYTVSAVSASLFEGADSAPVEAVDAYRAWAGNQGLAPDSPLAAFGADSDGGPWNAVFSTLPIILRISTAMPH